LRSRTGRLLPRAAVLTLQRALLAAVEAVVLVGVGVGWEEEGVEAGWWCLMRLGPSWCLRRLRLNIGRGERRRRRRRRRRKVYSKLTQ
jgi:hypothetical protein